MAHLPTYRSTSGDESIDIDTSLRRSDGRALIATCLLILVFAASVFGVAGFSFIAPFVLCRVVVLLVRGEISGTRMRRDVSGLLWVERLRWPFSPVVSSFPSDRVRAILVEERRQFGRNRYRIALVLDDGTRVRVKEAYLMDLGRARAERDRLRRFIHRRDELVRALWE